MLRYHSYVEKEPSLDAYRLDYCPRGDLGVVFICPFIVVTSASGKMYNAMRGLQGNSKNTVTNFGVYQLNGKLDQQCPRHYSYGEVPVAEPYWITETKDAVSYVGKHFRFNFGVDRYDWYDADGRVELHADRIGQVCTFWVPLQEGLRYPQMLRSHAARVTGFIDGEAVEGLFMLDYIYSRPDAMWSEMGMMTKLHNLWLNWLVKYDDGTYDGGYAWRGRPGSGFAAAHHVVNGVSTARSDAEIITQVTPRGTIKQVELKLGDEVSLIFDQSGSTDWPLHTCGTVSSTSRGKKIVESWNYTEFFPTNYQDVIDYQTSHNRLFGRYPSYQKLMANGKVVDQRLIFAS